MYRTEKTECEKRITVDIEDLKAMLGVGKVTAARIGEEAGAAMKIGKRKLYNVRKIEEYIDSITEM